LANAWIMWQEVCQKILQRKNVYLVDAIVNSRVPATVADNKSGLIWDAAA